MKVIIDGGFILSCMRKRIDFLKDLKDKGFAIIVPRESIQQLKDLKKEPYSSKEDRFAIDRALEIIEREKISKKAVGDQNVADWLIQKGNEGYLIGTSDAKVKNAVPNKVEVFEKDGTIGIDVYH